MSDGPAATAAHTLAELVPRLARLIAGTLERAPDVALTLRQYRMLQRLAERPHRTGELAVTSAVTQATASTAVKALEVRGLVTRTSDPADRRASLVALTESGREVLERATVVVTDRLLVVTEEMDEQAAAALVELAPVLDRGIDRARRCAEAADGVEGTAG